MSRILINTPGGASPPGVSTRMNQLPRWVMLSQIVRIQAIGARCRVFTHDGGQYTIPGNLAGVGRLVGSFWRVHKTHLVNPVYVVVSPGSVRNESRLRLKTGDYVPVARRRKQIIYQSLRQLQS